MNLEQPQIRDMETAPTVTGHQFVAGEPKSRCAPVVLAIEPILFQPFTHPLWPGSTHGRNQPHDKMITDLIVDMDTVAEYASRHVVTERELQMTRSASRHRKPNLLVAKQAVERKDLLGNVR